MTTIWHDLLRLVYPPLCRLCHAPLVKDEHVLCAACQAGLPRVCGSAGLTASSFFTPGLILPPGKVEAFLFYERENAAQRLIHDLKYHGHPETGYWLARQAAVALQQAGSGLCRADILVPIPLHPEKQKARGYNQAVPIAEAFHAVWGTPMAPDAIVRTRNTASQTGLSSPERWENVRDIFTVTDPDALAGKHILLIDDVLTTGATLSACARTLLDIPGTTVSFFALAIARL